MAGGDPDWNEARPTARAGVSPAAGRPLAKRLRPAAWLHLKRTEGPRALAAVWGAGRMLVIVLAQAA
jgi:hypothetical protein